MKPPLTQPTDKTDAPQQEASGDPYFLCTTPIVEPIFSTSSSSYLAPQVSVPVARLQGFLDNSTTETAAQARQAANDLCALLETTRRDSIGGGRAAFRRSYAQLNLSHVANISVDDVSLSFLRTMLTDSTDPRVSTLSGSILAGLSDLDQCLASRARRTFCRSGGRCERLAHKFEGLIAYVKDVQTSIGPITCRKFDRAPHIKDIENRLRPLLNEARQLMPLVPEDRAVRAGFEHRAWHAGERLNDFHLPEVVRALEGLVADMWEMKSVFRLVEAVDGKNIDRVAISRSRRHVPNRAVRA